MANKIIDRRNEFIALKKTIVEMQQNTDSNMCMVIVAMDPQNTTKKLTKTLIEHHLS